MLTRRQTILERLASHILTDLGCAAVTPSKDSWSMFALTGPYRFGWMPPMQLDENEPTLLIVSFCPELLAETTMWLDDDALDTYLTVIEAFLDGLVADSRSAPETVYRQIEHVLLETAPAALDLVSQVEGRALDSGIVPGASASS